MTALLLALILKGDGVSLARNVHVGDEDVYEMRISATGKLSPLGNPERLTISGVRLDPKQIALFAVLQSSHPGVRIGTLARWVPGPNGAPTKTLQVVEGYEWLPHAFVQNAKSLEEDQAESFLAGSVRLVAVKDSVAKLKVWTDLGKGLVMDVTSSVEIPTRRPNSIDGKIYRKGPRGLSPVQAFRLERIRSKRIAPIPQHRGG